MILPFFCHGILDQGYYHDGLFLPEHPDFYKTEIMNNKKNLGISILFVNILRSSQSYFIIIVIN